MKIIKQNSIIVINSLLIFIYYYTIKNIDIIVYLHILLFIIIYKIEKREFLNMIEYYKIEIDNKNEIIKNFVKFKRKRNSLL